MKARAIASALVLLAGSARAQSLMPGTPTSGGSTGKSTMVADPNQATDSSAIPVADRASRLFDLSTTTSSLQVDVGPIWYRPQNAHKEGFERGTGELAVSTVTTSLWKPFYFAGRQKLVFRAFDSKSYHVSLSTDFATGVYYGPFELESSIGLNIVNVSAFHDQWSGDLLSPRVSAAAAVHVWRFRVDIQAHSEYLWRWFGNDYLVRGITLGLRLDLPRADPPLMNRRSPR